jgi:CBS domain-containing protein
MAIVTATERLEPGRQILGDLAAGDVMTRPAVAVDPATPLPEVVLRMAADRRRALPVASRGVPIGIVTQGDVVARGVGAAVEPGEVALGAGDAEALVQRIARSGRLARDVMTPEPVVVGVNEPLRDAAERMARRHLKRLPVVDARGKLVGVLSRVDVLRVVAGGGWEVGDATPPRPVGAAAPLREVMRTALPLVDAGAALEDVLPVVAASGIDHALVVDAAGHLLGAISDADLLERLSPPVRRGLFSGALHGLPFGHLERDLAERRARARTAAELLAPVPTASPELALGEAIARVLAGAHKVLAIVDADGRVLGVIDRAGLLRALVVPGGVSR